jgi:hypothetical protein
LYVVFSIYEPIKSYLKKKKHKQFQRLISNPANQAALFLARGALIICLPCIIVLFAFANDAGNNSGRITVLVYFVIFLFFITLGSKALRSARGDYYLDNDGIHFVRSEKLFISYGDIEYSKWIDHSYMAGASTTTKLRAKGKHLTIYNLPKEQYERYVSRENIMTPKHVVKASTFQKVFSMFTVVIYVVTAASFIAFSAYSFQHGGDAINALNGQSITRLWSNPNAQHLLDNHGVDTVVSYSIWKTSLILECTTFILFPLVFICFGINFIWNVILNRKRYK